MGFLYFIVGSVHRNMPAKAVPAPESAMKRAAHKVQQSENFRKAIAANKAEKKKLKATAYLRGLKYSREYRAKQAKLVTLRRQAKSQGNYFAEEKPKVAVVMRIRGIAKVAPKQRKVLQLLRLRQIFNCVLVKLNKDKFNNEDLVCAEDLVNQIYTAGKHFHTVTNGLWPFKLAPPKGGMNQKRRHFVEGGDFGNRDTLINRFLARCI